MFLRKVAAVAQVVMLCGLAACKQSESNESSGKAPTGLATGLGASSDALSPASEAYNDNPIHPRPGASAMSTSGVSDVFGTLSVENFSGTQPNLTWTHESAAGFRQYLQNWYTANYVYQDGGVGTWQFHDVAGGDNWDKWTSGGTDYGIDGVLVAFHSSHGGMWSDGTFVTSLGTNWAGRGWNALSSSMALGGNAGGAFGDERLRYIFWDTCFGVRISSGHNPYRTWGARARGIRQIFGYETVSVDNPNYGRFFWEEYSKGKVNSYAFLDASWRINTGQVPVAVAFGASSSEASSRLDSERGLHWGAVSNAWAAWRWYAAAGSSSTPATLSVPTRVSSFRTEPAGNASGDVVELARSLGVNADTKSVESRPFGLKVVQTKGLTLSVEPDGDFEMEIARDKSNASSASMTLSDADVVNRAQSLIKQFNLAEGQQFGEGVVRHLNEAAASQSNPDAAQVRTVSKTVIFHQVVNGMNFIDPDAGHVAITFNSNGEAERVRSSVRRINTGSAANVRSSAARPLSQARQLALAQVANPPAPNEPAQSNPFRIMDGTEQVGYQMMNGQATPVYRALLQDPSFPEARPIEVIIPLAAPGGGSGGNATE